MTAMDEEVPVTDQNDNEYRLFDGLHQEELVRELY